MNIDIKLKISTWSSREKVPKYVKYKPKPDGSHLVNHKTEKEYNYYKCDYCEKEIIIKNKRDEQDGGIAILPNTLTGRGNIEVALHNRCLNLLLKEFNQEEDKRKIKVLSLFSGIGAFEKALKNIGQDYEMVGFSEIDKYAIKSYCAIHNVSESKNLGDITKIEITKLPKDIDLITHGSPCQDFSIAGKQAGAEKGSGTRSSLMWNTVDIIRECLPKFIIWENVKNILSQKHKHNFDNYIKTLEELGYNNYYQVLNAKDYGIPQNRERVYTVSIRKNVDNGRFKFPCKEKLELRLKDMLENIVDEKFYLSEAKVEKINNSNFIQEKKRIQEKEYCDTILARDWKDPKCVQVGNLKGGKWDKINESCRRVYSKEGISPTIHTCQGGNTEPKIEVIGNYSPSNHDASRIVNSNGLAPIVKENHGTVTATNINYRIRKLTPKECWRLMGFYDKDFEKVEKINSNTQLYKQARK